MANALVERDAILEEAAKVAEQQQWYIHLPGEDLDRPLKISANSELRNVAAAIRALKEIK
jgi:hypothetical protein